MYSGHFYSLLVDYKVGQAGIVLVVSWACFPRSGGGGGGGAGNPVSIPTLGPVFERIG